MRPIGLKLSRHTFATVHSYMIKIPIIVQSNRPEYSFSSILEIRHSDGLWRKHLHLLALTLVPAFLTCTGTEQPDSAGGREIIVKELPESRLESILSIKGFTETADIFIYRDSDGTLEWHGRIRASGNGKAGSDSINVYLWPGDYTAVAITDSPMEPNCSALNSYDSIELLSYDIREDSRSFPVKSCITQFRAGTNPVLDPAPLRSEVRLQDVTNGLQGYVLLESPRIFLENANCRAEVLRSEGFRPQETGLSTGPAYLPHDIGLYTQHPGTVLYCYPNDSESVSQTTPRTVFVFECEMAGNTVRFTFTLPPLHRGEIINVSLSIDSENEYTCKTI